MQLDFTGLVIEASIVSISIGKMFKNEYFYKFDKTVPLKTKASFVYRK